MARTSPLENIFPEKRIVSFDRRVGRFLFFSMVSDLVGPDDTVLDLGAGRGHQAESGGHHSKALARFKGRCREIIGADVDPIVHTNPYVDRTLLIGPDGKLDLPDASVDLIYSYAVLEHVDDPAAFAEEVRRVLKPGGWFCAWTPNKWGYVGIGARLVPNTLHAKLLKSAEPGGRKELDVFPTRYRMNTLGAIRGAFRREAFESFSFTYNGHPSYNFGSTLIARFWLVVMFLAPPPFRQSLFVFERKRAAG